MFQNDSHALEVFVLYEKVQRSILIVVLSIRVGACLKQHAQDRGTGLLTAIVRQTVKRCFIVCGLAVDAATHLDEVSRHTGVTTDSRHVQQAEKFLTTIIIADLFSDQPALQLRMIVGGDRLLNFLKIGDAMRYYSGLRVTNLIMTREICFMKP